MQQRELAISLMEHPMIRFLYESKVFHPSVINEVIVQEILREQETEQDEEGGSVLSTVLGAGQSLAGYAQKACEVISSLLNWLSLGVLGLGALLIPVTFGASMPPAMATAYAIDMVSTTFDFTAAVFALLAGNFADAFSNFLQGVVGVVMSTFTAGSGGSISKKASKEAIKVVYKKAAKEVAEGGAKTAVKIAGNEIAKNKAERLVKGLLGYIKSGDPEDSSEEVTEVQPDVASLNDEMTGEMQTATAEAQQKITAVGEQSKNTLPLSDKQEQEITAATTKFKSEHQVAVKKRMGQIQVAQQKENEGKDITGEFSEVRNLRQAEAQKIKEGAKGLGIPVPDFDIEKIAKEAVMPEFIKNLLSDDEGELTGYDSEMWNAWLAGQEDNEEKYKWYGQYIGDTAKKEMVEGPQGDTVKLLETYIQQINDINFEIPEGAPERLNLLLQTYLLSQKGTPEQIQEQTEAQPLISDEVYDKLPIDPNEVQTLKNWVNSNEETVRAMFKQQAPQEEGEAAPQEDFQQETIPAREVSASWKEYMDSFFGMRSQMTSFMNQYLLKDQAKMLNELLNILSQIKSGSTSPEEILSLSRIHDTIQEKINAQAILDSENIEDYGAEAQLVVSDPVKKNMRQHLESMVALLKDVREDVRNYEEYATQTNADPRYDGSSLKRKMDRSLSSVQTVIADLIKDIQVAIQDRKNIDDDEANIVAQDASRRQPQDEEGVIQEVFHILEGIELTEEDGSERQQKIQHVEKVYNELRRMYQGSLLPSLEDNKLKAAQTIGSQMLAYLIEDKKFLSYFPRTVVSGNKVMTLKQASSSLAEVIRTFVNVIRDMVPITKTQEVSKSTLEQASLRLKTISDAIESMFGVASEYNEEFMKEIVKDFAEQEDNQSLTDAPSFNREEIEPLLQKLADFINEEGLLSENLGRLVGDMGIENKKSFGRKVGKIFTKEEFEQINSYFENEQNRKSFISEYFKNEDSVEDSSELNADEKPDGETDISADEIEADMSDEQPDEEDIWSDEELDAYLDGMDATSALQRQLQQWNRQSENTIFKFLARIVERLYERDEFDKRLLAFDAGRAYVKEYLNLKAQNNPTLKEFIKKLENSSRKMNEIEEDRSVEEEFIEIESNIYQEFEEEKSIPDQDHTDLSMKMIGSHEDNKMYDFLIKRGNINLFQYLVRYTSILYRNLEKHLKNPTNESIEKTLKPIIQKMLKEHYNH